MGRARKGSDLIAAYERGSLSFRSPILNGDFSVWQRGTSLSGLTAGGTFVADRFLLTYGGGSAAGSVTYSRVTDAPSGFKYAARVQHVGSASSPNEYALRQMVEMQSAFHLIGQPLTASFWYKSNRTGNHAYRFSHNGITGASITNGNFSVSSADTWEFKVVPIADLASASGSSIADTDWGIHFDVGFKMYTAGLSSISAGDYFQVTGIRLEPGVVATPFERRAIEFDLCQRFYQTNPRSLAFGQGANSLLYQHICHVAMRSTPSVAMLTTTPYFEVLAWSSIGSITGATTNNGHMTNLGGDVIIYGTFSPTLTYGQMGELGGSVLGFSAEF